MHKLPRILLACTLALGAVRGLPEIYRTAARDPGRAAVTLERASRAWPLDSRVLSARAELLAEMNETSARRMLIDRTGKEARRQLESGRLEIGLLETVGLATDLLGARAQAEATYSAIRILRAEPEEPPRRREDGDAARGRAPLEEGDARPALGRGHLLDAARRAPVDVKGGSPRDMTGVAFWSTQPPLKTSSCLGGGVPRRRPLPRCTW